MASSSSKSAVEVNLLGKRKPEDNLETKPFLRRHKETSAEKEAGLTKRTLFIANLSPHSQISDIIGFFKNVVQLVRVRLTVTSKCVHRCYGFVEFASSNEAKKALEKKNGEYLLGQEIFLDVAKKAQYPPRAQYFIDHKVSYKDYFQQGSLLMEEDEAVEGLDETPHFLEGVLFVANLSPQTKIFHIKEFFNYVGEVVSVRLIVNHERKHVGYGFVDFASANEAKKALEKKNGEYLLDHEIFLCAAKKATYPPGHEYNLAEKLCYEDYLRRQNPVIEEDETVEGLNETPDFVEAVAVREKTLFVSHLSSEAEISDIIDFFKNVGEVVHVRLIVDNTGEHVGDGFVEFASANEAKNALEKKNGRHFLGRKIFLCVAKKAPYPPRPKYCIDHNLWYEDYLRRENLLIEEDEAMEGLDEIPDFVEEVAARKKTIFVANIPCKTKIQKIMDFFKDVGQIVRLRLIVDHMGKHVGCGFVEFSSVDEADEALEKKNGVEFSLDVVERAPYPLRPKYSLAEKLWSKVESLLIKEEDVEEGEEEEDLETEPDLENQEGHWMDKFCGKKIIFSYDD